MRNATSALARNDYADWDGPVSPRRSAGLREYLERRRTPRRGFAELLDDFCRLAEEITGERLTLEKCGRLLRWTHGSEGWTYPASGEAVFFFGFLTAVGPGRWFGSKYTLDGVVELSPDDCVIDCGAFVGGFSRAALEAGARVVAVEPSRTNVECLKANLRDQLHVHSVGLGMLSNENVPFRESSTAVDSSFGPMDFGLATAAYGVPMLTVDDFCARFDIAPTFLKIEAEGMEHAILRGMTRTRPAKVAVDGSPEGGSNDRERIVSRLEDLGYSVHTDRNMIYGCV